MTTTPAWETVLRPGLGFAALRPLAPLAAATLLAAFAAAPLCAVPARTATRAPRHAAAATLVASGAGKGRKGTKAAGRAGGRSKAPATAGGGKSGNPRAGGSSKAAGRHAARPVHVEDPPPFTVYQTRNHRTGVPVAHEGRPAEARVERSFHPASEPARSRPVTAPTTAPPVTTSDFLRAAGAPPSTASAPPQAATGATAFYASGQSQPDDDETLPRSKGEELEASGGDGSGPHNSATAAWKAPRPTAPRSVVLIAPQRAEVAVVRSRADASLPVTARADAQLPAPVSPANRAAVVSSGFGPEVDIATDGPVAKASPARRTKPAPAPVARNTPPPVSSLPVAERDAITDAAMRPVVLPTIYSRNGRVLLPAPLKGSREVLVHQNTMADADGLERIESEAQLNEMRASGLLIGFPETAALHVNDELPASHRTARPWTVHFANDIARRFYDRFRQPLIVTSAVRTIDYQLRLERVNGNAAGIEGATASPHLTGQALDLAKGRMNAAELAWMRAYLLPLMRAGLIDVEEEFQQSCFHISVYRRYAPAVRRAAAPVFKAETRAARVPADTAEDEER